MGEFDVEKACRAQKKYCQEHDDPHFAPYDGVCWKCRRNIYQQIGWKYERTSSGAEIRRIAVPLNSPEMEYTTGISVEKAATSLVIGCPHCNRSYCD